MKYEEFEKRYTDNWFSAGWIEVTPTKKEEIKSVVIHKDLTTLESELDAIQASIENIESKQLRLANLAKMYE